MKRILVVDDDRASCELLRERFDLVVSDINLESAQTGLDILRSLRETCPVILVTGFGTLDAAVEATREGAWDFISKPFKVGEVVATARRALERVSGSEADEDCAAPESFTARYEEAGLMG